MAARLQALAGLVETEYDGDAARHLDRGGHAARSC